MDDYGICGIFLMDYIRKGIDECIDEGDYQYNIDLGGSLFKDKKKFIKEHILENYYGKHLTLKDLAVELGVTVYTVTKWRDKALLTIN